MNTDIRVNIGLPRHPKYKKLKRLIGESPMEYLVSLWGYIAQYKPTGELSGWSSDDIEDAAGWCGTSGVFVSAMVEVGFMDTLDYGYYPHDWHDHQSWAAEALTRSEIARRAGKASAAVRKNKFGTAQPRTCAEHAPNMTEPEHRTPSPSPSPSPPPSPKAEIEASSPETETTRLSIFEFRLLYEQALNELMPPGLNNRATELCRLYPKQAIAAAFESTAAAGGKTLRYVEEVLKCKAKGVSSENQKPRGRPVTFAESASMAHQEASQNVLRRLLDAQNGDGNSTASGTCLQTGGSTGGTYVGDQASGIPGGVG